VSTHEQVPHPQVPQPQPPYPPVPYYQAHTEPSTDGFAITGFVLAMVSIFTFWMFLPPLLGIVFSAIGMSRTKNGKRKGRGLAVAGLVVSIIVSVGLTVWIIAAASVSASTAGA
jgi:hypothetical protein